MQYLPDNQIQNLLCKSYNDAAGQSEKAVASLARVVALQRQAHLHNAPAEQDNPHRADKLRLFTTDSGSPSAKAVTDSAAMSAKVSTTLT